MSTHWPTLELSLCETKNRLPLAAYIDPEGWEGLTRLKQPNIKSFVRRCSRTVKAARGLHASIAPGYTYGLEFALGAWHTFIAGSPGWTHNWRGKERVGVLTGIIKPLLERDVVNSLCWHHQSVAVSTRDDVNHRVWLTEAPDAVMPDVVPCVRHVRFDLDLRDGWSAFAAAYVAEKVKAIGDSIGLQSRTYSSGRRGIHAVFVFPVPVTNNVAQGIASLLRECIESEVSALAKVDADSTTSLLRLPGGNHSATMQLALFIDAENRCFFDAERQATLIERGLTWMPEEAGPFCSRDEFSQLTFQIESALGVTPSKPGSANRPHANDILAATGRTSHPLLDVAGTALDASSKGGHQVVHQTIAGLSSEQSDATEKARQTLAKPPSSGETYAWMTKSFGGVWACRLLHGESGIEVLLDILRQVPVNNCKTLRQRERTARALWKTFKFIPPKPRQRELHPVDILVVEQIVEAAMASPRTYNHRNGVCKGKLDIRLLQSLIKVAHVLMYSLRVSGGNEIELSSRNGSSVSEKLFPGNGVSRATFERVRRLLEDLSRNRYERTMPYQLVPELVSEGVPPLVPVFELQSGTTTRYKPSEWLIETMKQIENNLPY